MLYSNNKAYFASHLIFHVSKPNICNFCFLKALQPFLTFVTILRPVHNLIYAAVCGWFDVVRFLDSWLQVIVCCNSL